MSEPIPLGDSFVVGGAMLAEPGDSSGPPEEVINCRCTILPILSDKTIGLGTAAGTTAKPAETPIEIPSDVTSMVKFPKYYLKTSDIPGFVDKATLDDTLETLKEYGIKPSLQPGKFGPSYFKPGRYYTKEATR